MILEEERSVIEKSGVVTTNNFTLHANAKAFDILSSNIYTHKVRAVIREISCNAHDAHVDADINTPFEVHLPTTLEPFFSVRDYGFGLSEEEMYRVYTGYFMSTKTHTNKMIGALGLGTKSPFSLVDSFMVISYHNGKKSTYSCHRGEDRTPQISLMSQEETFESGIEVIVTINNKSQEFIREAINVFKYFDTLPNINLKEVVSAIEAEKAKYTLIGDDFAFTASFGNTVALMGNVAYNIPDELTKADLQGYIRFNVGELSFDPGRENLSLDTKTKLAIETRMNKICQVIKDRVTEELNSMTEWKRCVRFNEITHGPLRRICENMKEYLPKSTKTPMEVYSRYYGKMEKDTVSVVPIGAEYVYIWKDHGLNRRIKNFVLTTDKKVVVLTAVQAAEIGIDLSEIKSGKDILPKVYNSSERVKFDCYLWNGRTHNEKRNPAWDKVTLEDDEVRVYVIVENCSPVKYGLYHMQELRGKIGKVQIYGLTPSFIKSKKFDEDQWIELSDYVKSKLDATKPAKYYEFSYSPDKAGLMVAMSKRVDIPELHSFAKVYNLVQRQDEIYSKYFKLENDNSADELYEKILDKFPIFRILGYMDDDNKKILAHTLEKLNECSKKEEECGSGEKTCLCG